MIDPARANFPADLTRAAHQPEGQLESMTQDVLDSLKRYAREHPEKAALWALGIGFMLGWKLKPW